MEDGLAGRDEGRKRCAFGEFSALLVDGEVDEVNHVGDNVAGVLQANGHAVRAGNALEELEEVDGILLSKTESVVILLIISDTRQLQVLFCFLTL